ncbi:MAG TPA: response regulator transcription factor [Acidimicrobiales bacterium]|jgi:DNA-binding response OmpR family regulator|nr:response regulator transcription factor [Acidimicrobiales bacterium]HEV3268155.1 response regulator transcription factor [Acidimicrobiales bacterium]
MRVLVVEDHEDLSDVIARGLRREGFAVDVAHDGNAGWYKASVFDYDVVILDRDLPLLHGDELCRRLRSEKVEVRVLMLTASSSAQELSEGLGIGADDYVAKPFNFVELIARVRALARRPERSTSPILEASDIIFDTASRVVTRFGQRIQLARKELGVLEVLLAANGAVVSADDLLERVWDENIDPITTAVRTSIKKLRRKLGDPDPIETAVGVGYRIPR